MSNTLERSCPANMTPGEWAMYLEDRVVEIPTYRQPVFAENHSRRDWIQYERDCLRRMQTLTPEAAADVYMAMVAAKRRPDLLPSVESEFRIQERLACVSRDDVLCFLEIFNHGRTNND